MHWHGSCLAWLFFPAIFSPALALFSDEAYHIDYHHALLGVPRPHTTFFHRPSVNSKGSLLYSLSEQGILGAINPKDGSIIWRQSLVDTESPKAHKSLLRAAAEGNNIYSAINGSIQAWDAAQGRLVWEQLGTSESKDLEVLDFKEAAKDILVLTTMRPTTRIIKKLAANSGELLWEFKDER